MTKRFIAIIVAFSMICSAFLIVFAVEDIKAPKEEEKDYADRRTETVWGARGRIFDRNNVLLVDNVEKYDLIFEYGSMAYTANEVNAALLECLDILKITNTQDKQVEDFFIFESIYPKPVFAKNVYNTSTTVGKSYKAYLERMGLSPKTSAENLLKWMKKRYHLSEEKYSQQEIYELLKLRYDMDRTNFGAYQHYTIASGFELTKENEKELYSLITTKNIEGAQMLRQVGRTYAYEGYASHILGAIGPLTQENKDDEMYKYYLENDLLNAKVGITGCEYIFDDILRGVNGTKVYEYDEEGNLLRTYCDPEPILGNDIYLTIDIELQKEAEDSLAAEIERLGEAEAGAATAIDPGTGEALVIASYPQYDISSWNRALRGTYAPGSTYKIGAALAGLETKNITATQTEDCEKVYPFHGNPTCLGTHGEIDVSEAICVSCNIFFYYLGNTMGLDSITEYTSRLGLGVPTGIELNEAIGNIPNSKTDNWSPRQDADGAIGQSYHLYTPLQLSVYMSSIVNHGDKYSVHILKSRKEYGTDKIVTETKAEKMDSVSFGADTYSTLMSAMASVISENSEMRSYFKNIDADYVGGKTGTAETTKTEPDNALFSGFAKKDDKQIVATCVIEKGEHGSNASKIVADIFEAFINSPPTEDSSTEEDAE